MKCEKCSSFPLYICHCSNIYLCKTHLDKHLSKRVNHSFHSVFQELDPIEQSLFSKKLSTWVNLLKTLKKQVTLETKELLQSVSLSSKSALSKINSLLKTLQNFLTCPNQSFESAEIMSLFASSLESKRFSLTELNQKVTQVFSEELFLFKPDQAKFQVLKAKKFLKTHNGGFKCLAVSNDGKTLLTGSDDSSVRIWDLNSKNQLACFTQHRSVVSCIALNHDSSLAVSGSFDRKLILWDVRRKNLQHVFSGHSAGVYAVAFGNNCKVLVSGSDEREIMIWDIRRRYCLKKVVVWSVVWCCLVSSSDVVFTGIGNRLEIWDLASSNSLSSIRAHDLALTSVALSSDESLLVTCSDDKLVKVWDTHSQSLLATFSGHSQKVKTVSITPDNQLVISGSCDFSIILWSIESKSIIHQFRYHMDHVYGVACFNDFIFSASRDSRVGISRLSSKRLSCFLELQPFKVGSESMNGDLIAFGSANQVMLCDLSQNTCDFSLAGHDGLVRGTCLSPSSNLLASSSIGKKKNLFLWDLKTKQMISELCGHENSVFCVDIAQNELQAVSGDAKATVRLWDLTSLKQDFVFCGHSGSVYSVKFTRNQKFVASAGEDSKVMIWDLKSKNLFAQLNHSSIVWKVLVTLDDKFVVSGDFFGEVRIWNIEEKKLEFLFKSLEESREWLEFNKDLEFELTRYLL